MATVCPSTFFRVEIDASSSVKDCFGTASVLKSGWNSQWKVREGGTYYHMQLQGAWQWGVHPRGDGS